MNRHDWVGEAHNKAIDDFRVSLRNAGSLKHHMCSFVPAFLDKTDRFPTDRLGGEAQGRAAGINHVLDAMHCSRGARKTKSNVAQVLLPNPVQSQAATDALNAITNALDESNGPDDLASRLLVILESAAALPDHERSAIEVTVSVTQNSFEYWRNNLAAMVEEMRPAYEPCASGATSQGDAISDCFGAGESAAEVLFRKRDDEQRVRVAGLPQGAACPKMEDSWRSIWTSDAKGAFAGFWGGLFSPIPGAAVGGALIGGGGASIWAGLVEVAKLYYCGYAK